MRHLLLVGGLFLGSSAAQATLISGFEAGLAGWDQLGDVSIQDATVGSNPTQGQQMAFVSTLCDRENQPSQSGCETSTREHPYSDGSSPASEFAREFLGLPTNLSDFRDALPPIGQYFAGVGESGALKTSFFVPQGGLLSFDWNAFGRDGDTGYFSLWSDDPMSSFRTSDWLFYGGGDRLTYLPSDVELCTRYYNTGDPPSSSCGSMPNVELGWATRAVSVPTAGWYHIGFALGEVAEGSVPSVLGLDNLRFVTVPEPGAVSLLVAGLVAICARRRRDRQSDDGTQERT